jgi:hypothetical protein
MVAAGVRKNRFVDNYQFRPPHEGPCLTKGDGLRQMLTSKTLEPWISSLRSINSLSFFIDPNAGYVEKPEQRSSDVIYLAA